MKAFKTFILWLLLSVIPLQGIAINVMLTCKAAHQGTMKTLHAGEQMHLEHHAHGGMHDGAHVPSDDRGQPDHFKSADGSCTAYCGGPLWMHAEGFSLPILLNSSSHIAYIAFHVPFVVPDGPERPPRFLSV